MQDKPLPQRPYIGAHLLIKDGNKILLMKRSGSTSLGGRYTLIAGKVDQFENPTTAMIREAYEEIGIKIEKQDLKLVSVFHRANTTFKGDPTDIIEFIFTTGKWSGEITNKEPHLCDDLSFFELEDIPASHTDTVTRAIQSLEDGEMYHEVKSA